MLNMRGFALIVIGLFTSQTANADVWINFIESAPKDRFVIENRTKCELRELVLEIDLGESVGKLIFDTTAAGEGVEVFQPFEVRTGEIELISTPAVSDGDSLLSVKIKRLAAEDSASFTIDVDDTLARSELGNIRVSGAEIENGRVAINFMEVATVGAQFDRDSKAIVVAPSCSELGES